MQPGGMDWMIFDIFTRGAHRDHAACCNADNYDISWEARESHRPHPEFMPTKRLLHLWVSGGWAFALELIESFRHPVHRYRGWLA